MILEDFLMIETLRGSSSIALSIDVHIKIKEDSDLEYLFSDGVCNGVFTPDPQYANDYVITGDHSSIFQNPNRLNALFAMYALSIICT